MAWGSSTLLRADTITAAALIDQPVAHGGSGSRKIVSRVCASAPFCTILLSLSVRVCARPPVPQRHAREQCGERFPGSHPVPSGELPGHSGALPCAAVPAARHAPVICPWLLRTTWAASCGALPGSGRHHGSVKAGCDAASGRGGGATATRSAARACRPQQRALPPGPTRNPGRPTRP